MKRIFAITMLIVSMWAANAWATDQAVVFGEETIGITGTGNADWGGTQKYFVKWIFWKPSAANDVLCILDGSGGPPIIWATAVTGDSMIIYPYIYCKPFFDYSACTIGTGANYKVTIAVDKNIH